MSDAVRLVPLGGFGEIGKNLAVLECAGQLLLIDVGIAFPDEEQALGAELLIPNFNYLRENADKIVGCVLTHGHEDHIGGLPYLLRDIPMPVYGTPLTLGLVRVKLGQNQVETPPLETVHAGDRFSVGLFEVEYIRVNHSIPDSVAVAVRTPAGIIVHSGDFKFDHTPIDGEVTDFAAFARLGDEGVRLLISDSTNIDRPGHTPSEAVVGEAFRQLFPRAPGRIVIATFASQIHRIQQVVDTAGECGRKVLVAGRSMERNVNVARELGYLDFPESVRIGYGDLPGYRDEEVVILITGSQGEPVSGLTRMAKGSHPKLRMHPDDTVILSATPIPGNEATIWKIVNDLHRAGAEVIDHRTAAVHVSGHASAEEIKLLFNLLRPDYAVPFHGEFRHMRVYGDLAQDVGLSADRIYLLQNGDVLRLDARGAALDGTVEHGTWTIEGRRVNELGTSDAVVQDRIFLAESGVICGALAWDLAAGEPLGRPEIAVRGVRVPPEWDESDLLSEAAARVAEKLAALAGEDRHDRAMVERTARRALRNWFEKTTRTYPVLQMQVLGLGDTASKPCVSPADEERRAGRALLTVDGEVEHRLEFTADDLASLAGEVETAVALREIMAAAGPEPQARQVRVSARDERAAELPLAGLDDVLLLLGSDEPETLALRLADGAMVAGVSRLTVA